MTNVRRTRIDLALELTGAALVAALLVAAALWGGDLAALAQSQGLLPALPEFMPLM